MQLPEYLTRLSLPALPLDYEWDDVIRDTLLDPDDERDMRLAEALSELRDEAVFTLGLASAQWIVARLHDAAHPDDVRDALQRIEAMWALAVDLRYARLTEPADLSDNAPPEAEEPLWASRRLLHWGFHAAIDGEAIQGDVMSHILIARQVLGRHKGFSTWLTQSLRKAKAHYAQADDDDEDSQLVWRPVPPDLYSPDFEWPGEADAQASVDAFLAGLDPAANPYLRSPQDMLSSGFTGRPYGR